MENSMGQIVPMTSLALSQSMDSVNTATNEEEVSAFQSIFVFLYFLKKKCFMATNWENMLLREWQKTVLFLLPWDIQTASRSISMIAEILLQMNIKIYYEDKKANRVYLVKGEEAIILAILGLEHVWTLEWIILC